MTRLALLLLVLLFGAGRAGAFELPGLDSDASAYATSLTGQNPAGGTPQLRRQAETRAADAQRRNDWAGVASALEARIGAGQATGDQWLALARAQLRRTPPDNAHAAQAAYQAFQQASAGEAEVQPLLVLADALRGMDRPAQAIEALEEASKRVPEDAGIKRLLADARRAAGILVRQVRTEPEADPPRACIVFTTAPARRADLVPGDWVRVEPARPDLAVTREGDQFCLTGLPPGSSSKVTLRSGLPGEDGLRLNKDAVLTVAMGNRKPRLIFDGRLFVLPQGQSPRVTLTSINLSAAKLKLMRLSERSLVPWVRENKLGGNLERYAFSSLDDTAATVWEGRADIPGYRQNQLVRTALPLPDAFGKPGVYILTVVPGDGTDPDSAFAAQVIVRTDLAPTAWRGSDGLVVQLRAYSDAKPREGARVDLLARNNDILAQGTTDAEGVVRFASPLLAGDGPLAPQTLNIFAGNDFATLDLTAASFDLSDRGVEGAVQPGPLDAFAWTDRGIYRPGETVNLMALLRTGAGQPADVPVRVAVKRPNGQTFLQAVPARSADASIHLPIALSASAPAGMWTVEFRADPARPPIGRASFRVDAFVPDRMAVEVKPPQAPIVPGQPYAVPVAVRYLYGAPGAGLTGKATLRLSADAPPPPALVGYRIGMDGEEYAPDAQELTVPDTDPQGGTVATINLPRVPDTTRPVQATLAVTVDDPSGRGVTGQAVIAVRPAGNMIGIKPLFDGSVDAGGEAAFEVAAVNPSGARAALRAKLRLVRERPDWRMVVRGGLSRFETTWRDEPLETQDVSIPATGVFRFAKRLDFGRYRLEVSEAGGLAASSVRFRAGWVASDSPDVPDKVDVAADKRLYAVGATARVHVAPPFAGQATLLVLSDRVHALRDVEVPAGGADFDVPVGADWGPGAYVAVHVFRPGGSDAQRPGRAIGLTWVGVDPAARKLDVSVAVPDKVAPRQRVTVPVRTAPGAWVSLAAVDEGILRLTDFKTPDPGAHFLGRRRLGLDIRDDWGRLIRPAEGDATALRQGGDDGGSALPEIPQKIVSLFTPPVQAGPDGQAAITLDLPDFNGQVRLMAVSWLGDRIGAVGTDLVVRDGLIAEPLLPRFLAPGDEARLAVQLQNLDLPAGDVVATVSVSGPLALTGPARLQATLAPGAQSLQATGLRGTGAGRGTIRLDVTGPGGFRVQRETAILVRPSRPATSVVAGGEIAPGAQASLAPPIAQFVDGTWTASARFGGPVRYDSASLVRALHGYPLSCLEQATSRAFPLALLPDGPVAGADRAARLQAGVTSVLDRQRYDGAFALWTANGEAEEWLTPYATEFLLRARTAGAAVPDAAVADAVKYMTEAIQGEMDSPAKKAAQAYRLYALAMAGQARPGAARVLAEDLGGLPTPLSRAQLGAALARSNDRPRAEAAFAAALDAPARKPWIADYGSALRDQTAIAVLLKESGLLPDRLRALLASLPGADLKAETLSTQEEAWAAAAAAVLGRDGRPVQVALDGRTQPAATVVQASLTGPATAKNLDDRAVWQTVSVTGVTRDPAPAARSGMRVSRKFFTATGDTLDLDKLRQNTVFVLLIEGRADDGQDHQAMLIQGLPAGWEIAGRLNAGAVPGLSWLGELTETDAQPAADDRFAAVMKLTGEKPGFRVAVRLRAVTPGEFEMPGAQLSDMYQPGVFARQATNRIKVLPAE